MEVNRADKKSLSIMYWIPKLHENPVGSRFIIASKSCSTNPLSKAVSNVFKLIYSRIENFQRKFKLLSNYKKFWVLENVDPVIKNINILNRKKKGKSIATYDFSTLYTTLPHNKLIKRLCNVIDFVFEGGNRTRICISLELLNRMKAQGAQCLRCSKALSKIIQRHEKAFVNLGRNCDSF